MIESNDFSPLEDSYSDYIEGGHHDVHHSGDDDIGLSVLPGLSSGVVAVDAMNFEDPKIALLPRVLLMGPRRGGKTSIQVCSLMMTTKHLVNTR
jgi:hypothetical protein